MSLELKVMQSFNHSVEVIKNSLISEIQSAAVKGEIQLTNENFAYLTRLIGRVVEQAGRNSMRQMQSACAPAKEK